MTETLVAESHSPNYDDLFDLTGIEDEIPAPFSAPKFQANYTHGTYVEARYPQFKVHENKGHAKRSVTMTNSRLWANGTVALSNCAIYEQLPSGEWVPIETYPAGTELPWRSRSSR